MNDDTHGNIETEATLSTESCASDSSDSSNSFLFKEYVFLVLLITGIVILGFYLMYLANSIHSGLIDFSYSDSGVTPVVQHREYVRILATIAFNRGFIYAVIGIAVVLIALHLRNSTLSNKAILPVAILSGLNAAFLSVSLLIIISTHGFSSEFMRSQYDMFNQPGNLVLAFLEIVAFIALVLIELPRARRSLVQRFRAEAAEEESEEGVEDE